MLNEKVNRRGEDSTIRSYLKSFSPDTLFYQPWAPPSSVAVVSGNKAGQGSEVACLIGNAVFTLSVTCKKKKGERDWEVVWRSSPPILHPLLTCATYLILAGPCPYPHVHTYTVPSPFPSLARISVAVSGEFIYPWQVRMPSRVNGFHRIKILSLSLHYLCFQILSISISLCFPLALSFHFRVSLSLRLGTVSLNFFF